MRKILALLACIAGTTAGHAASPPPAFELVLVDMQGNKEVLGTLPDSVIAPRVSPDGKQVAFELNDPPTESPTEPQLQRLYVAALNRLDQRRALPFTGPGLRNQAPIWSPDGKRLVYLVAGVQPDALYWRAADGTGEPEHLIDASGAEGMHEGGKLSFITLTGERNYGISMLDIATKAATRLIDFPDSEQHSSRVAPDGRWFAYVSSETGRQEVWLAPLPRVDDKRYQISKDGGRHPLWSPDGERLYFSEGGKMFRIDIYTGGAVPAVGQPRELPIKGFLQGDLRRQYDLTPDGDGFVMLFPIGGAAR